MLVAYVPWMAYQAFYDPPGNVLIKMHLAGLEPDDPRGSLRAIADAYSALPLRTILENKLANLAAVAGDAAGWLHSLGALASGLGRFDLPAASDAAINMRGLAFVYLGPALGPLAIGPLLILAGVRLRTPAAHAARVAWLCALMIVLFWCATMFGPGTTQLQSGPFLLPLIAAAGSILAAWRCRPASPWPCARCRCCSMLRYTGGCCPARQRGP